MHVPFIIDFYLLLYSSIVGDPCSSATKSQVRSCWPDAHNDIYGPCPTQASTQLSHFLLMKRSCASSFLCSWRTCRPPKIGQTWLLAPYESVSRKAPYFSGPWGRNKSWFLWGYETRLFWCPVVAWCSSKGIHPPSREPIQDHIVSSLGHKSY